MKTANFFANLGKGDYFNLDDRRLPLDELLQNYLQPDGWLLSLAYRHQILPQGRKIIDCGANSYREQQVQFFRLFTPVYKQLSLIPFLT